MMNNQVIEPIDISKSKVLKRGYNRKNGSINAKRYAEKVIEKVSKGEKVIKKRLALEVGYSEGIASQPGRIESQEAYKNAIATYEHKLVSLRDKTINALAKKDLDKEKLYDVTGLLKVVDHSTALIQGKATENIAHKQEIVVFGSEDFLSRQLANGTNGSVKP